MAADKKSRHDDSRDEALEALSVLRMLERQCTRNQGYGVHQKHAMEQVCMHLQAAKQWLGDYVAMRESM